MPTSTIIRTDPPPNTPVASAVVRANFGRAANDIDALWTAIGGLVTGVSSFNGRTGTVILLDSDVTNALGFDPALKMGTVQWITPVNTATPISLIAYAQYAFTVNRLNNLSTSAGTTTLSMLINGTPITGLNGLAVSAVAQNPAATAANLVSVGDELTFTLAATAGAANLKFSMLGTI